MTKQSLSLEFTSHIFGELSFGTWCTELLLLIEICVVQIRKLKPQRNIRKKQVVNHYSVILNNT